MSWAAAAAWMAAEGAAPGEEEKAGLGGVVKGVSRMEHRRPDAAPPAGGRAAAMRSLPCALCLGLRPQGGTWQVMRTGEWSGGERRRRSEREGSDRTLLRGRGVESRESAVTALLCQVLRRPASVVLNVMAGATQALLDGPDTSSRKTLRLREGQTPPGRPGPVGYFLPAGWAVKRPRRAHA